MADETRVRVRLDTGQAKQQLRGFVRESAAAAGRVTGNVRGALTRGLGLVGAGAAVGTGLGAVRGATSSGLGDVVGESFGLFGSEVADFFLGDLDERAKAARSAREETIQAFGAIAGARGAIPPGARNFFESVRSIRLEEEKGRDLFERDERFRGPGIGELIDRIMTGIGNELTKAVDLLAEKLLPWNW